MDPSRLDKLSERQKECLRLVYQNYDAKQIGRKLSISPNTVNRHLQDARLVCGTSRSMDIAILLVKHEGGHRITTKPIGIPSLDSIEHERRATVPDSSAALARNRFPAGMLTRIALIFAIAASALVLAGAAVNGVEGLTRLFWAHRIDISDAPYRK